MIQKVSGLLYVLFPFSPFLVSAIKRAQLFLIHGYDSSHERQRCKKGIELKRKRYPDEVIKFYPKVVDQISL